MQIKVGDNKKSLRNIDPVYNNVKAFMTSQDKIDYCQSLISETENFLASSSKLIDEKVIEKYELLIDAAKKELKSLANE